MLEHLGYYLGVGVAFELKALLLKLGFKLRIVFDNAVVNDREKSAAANVRMGVCDRGSAVRCPACVTDTYMTVYSLGFFSQSRRTSDNLSSLDFRTVSDGKTCRIVASVFKLLKSRYDYIRSVFIADVAHNSAHRKTLSKEIDLYLFYAEG